MVSWKIDIFNIGNRSSKGVCSIAMLVFGGGMYPENTGASDRIFYCKSNILKRMVQWFHTLLCVWFYIRYRVSPSEAIPKNHITQWPRAPTWAQARKTDPQLSFKNLSIFSFSAEGSRKIRWQRINSWVKHLGSPESDHESIHGLKSIHIQLIFAASIIPKMDQCSIVKCDRKKHMKPKSNNNCTLERTVRKPRGMKLMLRHDTGPYHTKTLKGTVWVS